MRSTDNVTVAINKFNGDQRLSGNRHLHPQLERRGRAISAVEDASVDGDKDTTFTVSVSASGDSNYTAVADASVPGGD